MLCECEGNKWFFFVFFLFFFWGGGGGVEDAKGQIGVVN